MHGSRGIFLGEDSVLERKLDESKVGEEGGPFAGFALAEGGSSRRDPGVELLEVQEGSKV